MDVVNVTRLLIRCNDLRIAVVAGTSHHGDETEKTKTRTMRSRAYRSDTILKMAIYKKKTIESMEMVTNIQRKERILIDKMIE
jgi:hypothetical protein